MRKWLKTHTTTPTPDPPPYSILQQSRSKSGSRCYFKACWKFQTTICNITKTPNTVDFFISDSKWQDNPDKRWRHSKFSSRDLLKQSEHPKLCRTQNASPFLSSLQSAALDKLYFSNSFWSQCCTLIKCENQFGSRVLLDCKFVFHSKFGCLNLEVFCSDNYCKHHIFLIKRLLVLKDYCTKKLKLKYSVLQK